MKYPTLILLFILPVTVPAQRELSLAQCHTLAREQSPLGAKTALLEEQHALNRTAILTARLPRPALDAKATYQSDVTFLPVDIPNMPIEPVSKDQYGASITVTQSIYDGGATRQAIAVEDARYRVRQQETEVQLYQLQLRINQQFFAVLLAQARREDLQAKRDMLEARQSEIMSAVTHGVLDKSAMHSVEVELLRIDQATASVEQSRRTAVASLFALVGIVDTARDVTLTVEDDNLDETMEMRRPELQLFTMRQELSRARASELSSQTQPRLAAFVTGGYGRPGLNMLENTFSPYYIAGVRLDWTPFNWGATKKQREALELESAIVSREREDFQRNVRIELDRLQSEMASLLTQIEADEEIIALREEIVATRTSQLRNGLITPGDYIDELTDLHEAKNALSTHRIQYQHARANYRTIKGN